jgi:hypothetical protein
MGNTMKAFHNDPAIKAKYLARVDGHIKADNLIRGTGWDGFRGCAVGCTLEAYDHARYPIELGIPEWLAEVEDRLFEGMTETKAHTWPRDFLDAITPGADLEKIKGPFLIIVLESALTTFDHEKYPDVKAAIDGSIALWRREDIGSDEWRAAARAAAAAAAAEAAAAWAAWAWAARAAWAAARAAAAAAEARAAEAAAAWAARAAEAAAEAAEARAAEAAAAWAARAAEAERKYDYFADELLKLLKSAE